ncbi:MAG: DUF4325 domain-containing protein [Ignavibacteriaceae bacterium]|nr:DUF4325 domain-containing protein [Ignavibacteriaceae bacterium]
MKLFIKDIVKDTYTNASGYALLIALQYYFRDGQQITLSFKDTTPTSTSFLNSSVGELLDQYGFSKFKSLVKFVDMTVTQSQVLKNYFHSGDLKS